ncbi:DEAD/DEAH box helicase family protein [Microbulbifer rhizosphaerae]|nr:DEAD/DEAH box helicase family protein [Microbulbifer rhizosphaerae]
MAAAMKKPTAKAPASKSGVRGKKAKKQTLEFRHHLVLTQWLFSLFGFESVSGRYPVDKHNQREAATLEAFRDRFQLMGDVTGRNGDGVHRIVEAIIQNYDNGPGQIATSQIKLTEEQLLDYDRHIKQITDRINLGRQTAGETPLEWKYFQYLALLFTEIYLDYFFTRPQELLEALNEQIQRWNQHWLDERNYGHKPLKPLNADDDLWPQLARIAFWSATGSGKTLLMHANIQQFRYYLKRFGKARNINKIILLTPNEGLTRQHLQELKISGIEASEFSARGGQDDLFAQNPVLVIDINKLRDSEKNKTVAVDSFGANNLLLVDEGHRGTASGGGTWLDYRRKLCARGFSFEYSATFAQSSGQHENLRQIYTKSILLDYSYRHFYSDGYGKQSQILNLEKNLDGEDEYRYLVASLLSFYQQLRLFDDQPDLFKRFNLYQPLWVFVSSKVTGKSGGLNAAEATDTVKVLQFIDRVLSQREATEKAIEQLLNKGMETAGGRNLLDGRFNYLKELDQSAADLYSDILERIFHTSGGRLYIENITGVAGEIALRGGVSDTPFGVINVGDDSKLVKLCESHDLLTQDARFSSSLFNTINSDDSQINLLLGSKKFTEGWSSWRVSNMTLMNVGKNEGAQIIQLFGRGVRLKGFQTTLKRSTELINELKQAELERPRHIGILETLNLFGVKADYIAQFRKELEDEEIPVNHGLIEYELPLAPMKDLPDNLPVIRLKPAVAGKAIGGAGSAFVELAEQVELLPPAEFLSRGEQGAFNYFCNPPRVELDFYPRVGAFSTDTQGERQVKRKTQRFTSAHLAVLDIEALYFDLLAFKRDRRWSNLTLSQDRIVELLSDDGWYQLQAPDSAMALGDLGKLPLWHEMAGALLRKYCEMFYGYRRKQWEADKLEYRPITENNQYLFGVSEQSPHGSYTLTLDSLRHDSLIKQLDNLRTHILNEDVAQWKDKVLDGLEFLWCERHFYQPLVAATQGLDFQVSPVSLNKGEAQFVKDLQKAWEQDVFKGFELYLLRNQSGQGAVGAFIDGGFYPDFILWLVRDGKQHVIFVDPKGLRNHTPSSPKVKFHKTIKDIEAGLIQNNPANSNIQLDAFLISNTPKATLLGDWRDEKGNPVSEQQLEDWNILFEQDEEAAIRQMVQKIA